MKPLIRRNNGQWECACDTAASFGHTPLVAFKNWLQRLMSRYEF